MTPELESALKEAIEAATGESGWICTGRGIGGSKSIRFDHFALNLKFRCSNDDLFTITIKEQIGGEVYSQEFNCAAYCDTLRSKGYPKTT